MIFGFKQQSLLDEKSVFWILDVFEWVQRTHSQKLPTEGKHLILPNNDDFPGNEGSIEGMASLIFSQVQSYLGLSSLACALENENGIHPIQSDSGSTQNGDMHIQQLIFAYHTQSLMAPEVLIASFVHQLAFYIVTTSETFPPGGKENLPHVAELLAVFSGFGIIMANSANTQKIRSCASCSGPAIERESFLSQYDVTYALAIYCVLKHIPVNDVTKWLKKSLRPFYKKAAKEIQSNNFIGNNKLKLLTAD